MIHFKNLTPLLNLTSNKKALVSGFVIKKLNNLLILDIGVNYYIRIPILKTELKKIHLGSLYLLSIERNLFKTERFNLHEDISLVMSYLIQYRQMQLNCRIPCIGLNLNQNGLVIALFGNVSLLAFQQIFKKQISVLFLKYFLNHILLGNQIPVKIISCIIKKKITFSFKTKCVYWP